jgi:hypothetical protein
MSLTDNPFACETCGADPTHLADETIEHAAGRSTEPRLALFCAEHKPDISDELCTACRPRATDRNHPSGMTFVGWGHGWQPCQRCGGSGLEKTRHCG